MARSATLPPKRLRRQVVDGAGFQPAPKQTDAAALHRRIAALEQMTLDDLRTEWRRVIKTSPQCRLSADLLRRCVAHRLQEAACGGCSRQTMRKLAAAASRHNTTPEAAISLKTGTSLVREWHGRTYIVHVLEDGLLYEGQHFASLTGIAREITGAAWSGPRFFGVAGASTAFRSRAEGQVA